MLVGGREWGEGGRMRVVGGVRGAGVLINIIVYCMVT